MLSAFTARPIVELRQRDKSKIESVLAFGRSAARAKRLQLILYRRSVTSRVKYWQFTHISSQRNSGQCRFTSRSREVLYSSNRATRTNKRSQRLDISIQLLCVDPRFTDIYFAGTVDEN